MRLPRIMESATALLLRRPSAALGMVGAVVLNVSLVLIHNTLRTSDALVGRVLAYLLLGMGIVVIAGVYRALEEDRFVLGLSIAGFALATEVTLMYVRPHLWGTLGSFGAVALDLVGFVCAVFACRLRYNRLRQVATVHQFPARPSASGRHAA